MTIDLPFVNRVAFGNFWIKTLFSLFLVANAIHFSIAACGPPANLKVNSVSLQNASIQWNDFNQTNPIFWELRLINLSNVLPDTVVFSSIFVKSFSLTTLLSSHYYEVAVRSYCGTDGFSTWSNPIRFYTHLTNPSKCNMSLPLENNNCSNLFPQRFYINVNGIVGDSLGIDVFIDSIRLIVDHPFPADLKFSLTSPSGQSINLITFRGTNAPNIGIPNLNNCSGAMNLKEDACVKVGEASAPFVGYFKPEQPFKILSDTTNPNGIWILSVCDDHPSDIGFLDFFEIGFTQTQCSPPADIFLGTDEYHAINGIIPSNQSASSQLIVEYGRAGFSPGLGNSPGTINSQIVVMSPGDTAFRVSNLLAERDFEAYYRRQCQNKYSSNSCVSRFSTLCEDIAIASDFEQEIQCVEDCEVACNLVGFFKNSTEDDMDWIISSGSSSAEFTGPSLDRKGRGHYAYIETSNPTCRSGKRAILESECFRVSPSIGNCHISFYYYMYGPDVNHLSVSISEDEGKTWQTLFDVQGDQGKGWKKQFVSLTSFIGKVVKIRWIGYSGEGSYGDIAIDDIYIYKNSIAIASTKTYFEDRDRDSYGSSINPIQSCLDLPPVGYVSNALDCDDNSSLIRPNRSEVKCNLVDENCNGMDDDAGSNLSYSVSTFINETCQGLRRGDINIIPGGGVSPYSVLWSNSSGGTHIYDLIAGTYWATITDAINCRIITEPFTVNLVSPYSIIVDLIKPASCSGKQDGEIKVTTSNGTNTARYFWSSGQSWPYLQSIPDGEYTVTVVDNVGCQEILSNISLAAENNINIQTLAVNQVTCVGHGNGSIRLAASGATAPYNFWWSNGVVSDRNLPLHPGTYTVTVYDSGGCHKLSSYQITSPDTLKVKISGIDPVLCYGKKNGAIYARGEGGSQPYSYIWNDNTSSYVTKDLVNIGTGLYTVRIFDANGCVAQESNIRVDHVGDINVFIDSIRDVSCRGSNDGYVKVRATGGYGPFRYLWSNGSNDSIQKSLSAGEYGLNVIDRIGCKDFVFPIAIKLLDQGLPVSLLDKKNPICYADELTYIKAAVVGNPPFNFHWSNGRNISTSVGRDSIFGIGNGLYNLTVTDSKGCLGLLSQINITGPNQALSYLIRRSQNPVCFYSQDGFIDLLIQGGVSPYTYRWSHGPITEDIFNLSNGFYICSITDGLGCVLKSTPIEIRVPDTMRIRFSFLPPSTGLSNGWIQAEVTGGSPGYFYQWDANAGNQQNARAINLSAGQYWLSVFDSKGCRDVVSFYLPTSTSTDQYPLEFSFDLFPTISNGQISLQLKQPISIANVGIEVLDDWGRILHKQYLDVNAMHTFSFDFPSGHYILALSVPGYKKTYKRFLVFK